MKKRIRNSILVSLCACTMLATGAGIGFAQRKIVKAEDTIALSQTVTFESEYALGTELEIPSLKITVNGTEYPTESVLRYPDGNAVSGAKATLDVVGKYVLEYRANTPDGIKSIFKEFNVYETVYSAGSKSSAEYGSVANASDKFGIVSALAYGDKLLYNRVIDLNGNTKNDSIVKLFVNPTEQGLADALNLVMVLTDAHDSANFVTITTKRLDRDPLQAAWQEQNAYITANAVGQPATGLERSGSGTFAWEGGLYALHRNDIYGAGIKFSLSGVPKINADCSNIGVPTDIGTQSLNLSMDYEARRVYMNNSIVADLDDVSIFPSMQWKGFTTGECFLSIYATSYNQDNFNFVVTEIDGASGEALNEEYIIDGVAPQMELVKGEYVDGFPKAVVGRTYPIPEVALVGENDPNVTVTAKVYRVAGNDNLINVTLKDGKFIPTLPGNYRVVYTAKDRMDNTSTLVYEVEAKVCADPLNLQLSGDAENGETGQMLTVPSATVLHPQGISSVKVFAKLQGADVVEEIPTAGEYAYQFRPLYEGQWKIEYVYADYMETKTKTLTVSVAKNLTPYIEKEVSLPKYLIQGAMYKLPTLEGYAFDTGAPVLTKCDIYVQDDEGTERKLNGTNFTSYATSKTTVIYRLGNGGNVSEKRYQIPVVNVGYDSSLRIADYFVGENFTKDAQNDRILIQTQATGTQSFEFINPLQVFDFKTVFHVSNATNKFQVINIYLQDSKNREIEIKVSYKRNTAGNTIFTVNDGSTTYKSTADFIESNQENFRLFYNNETRKISPSTAFGVLVEKDLNGNDFYGFPSQNVYMRVELAEITGKAGVEFLTINNQPMSKVAYDLLSPEISVNIEKGKKKLGEEVVIKATYVADVLDPDVEFKMYVKTPSKNYAVSKDGITLDETTSSLRDYTVVANEYGTYEVYYEAVDTNNRRTIYSYVFTVVDTEPPVISLGGKITTAKVGDTVAVANAAVKDDLTKCTLLIKVIYPNGSMVSLAGNSFVATQAGEYVVYYFAYDETFNMTTVSYVITVS